MAEERVVPTRPPVNGNGAPVVATTERTGEGDVYYTGPRPAVMPPSTPAMMEPGTVVAPAIRDRIRWQSIAGGIITALTTMAVLSMLGAAIGFSVFGAGSDPNTIGIAVGIWAAVSAFISFLAGGWVAGRTAGVAVMGNALLNGFLVGGTVLVIVLWAAAAGVGNIFGFIGGSAGGIVHAGISNPDALRSAFSGGNGGATGGQIQSDAAMAAWWVFGATIIGLIAATLGGWLGWMTRFPREIVARR